MLEIIAEQPGPIGLTDLAAILKVNRNTLHRFLHTFQEAGYIDRSNDRFRIGIRVLKLAGAMLSGEPVRDLASPYLVDLMLRTNEASHLTIRDGHEIVYVDKVDSPHPVRMYSYVGLRQAAYATASGKAILAFISEAELQLILAQGLTALTERTITDPRAFRQHLSEVRKNGYAIDDEEAMQDVRCVAAPIFDFDDQPVAAVSVSAPASRLSLRRAEEIAPDVLDVAQRVSSRFGFRKPLLRER